jgi:ribosome-associated protein
LEVKISSEYITLAQFLKKVNIISSGGEAKIFLSSEQVYVNGQRDERRGRKLYAGDTIQIFGKKYTIKGSIDDPSGTTR